MELDDNALMNALARVAAHHERPASVRDDRTALLWAIEVATERALRRGEDFLARQERYRAKYAVLRDDPVGYSASDSFKLDEPTISSSSS